MSFDLEKARRSTNGIIIYRLSHSTEKRSMWYDPDGKFDPVFKELEEIPMDTDTLRLDLGAQWLSSVKDPDLLERWFPNLLPKLKADGFVLNKFFSDNWLELPNEIVFHSGTAIKLDLTETERGIFV